MQCQRLGTKRHCGLLLVVLWASPSGRKQWLSRGHSGRLQRGQNRNRGLLPTIRLIFHWCEGATLEAILPVPLGLSDDGAWTDIFDYSLINNSKPDHSVKSFLDFWHSESVEIVSVCYFKPFSATLHSVGYIFPFLFCLTFLCFSQLFVKPSQTTTLPSCISFSLGWF